MGGDGWEELLRPGMRFGRLLEGFDFDEIFFLIYQCTLSFLFFISLHECTLASSADHIIEILPLRTLLWPDASFLELGDRIGRWIMVLVARLYRMLLWYFASLWFCLSDCYGDKVCDNLDKQEAECFPIGHPLGKVVVAGSERSEIVGCISVVLQIGLPSLDPPLQIHDVYLLSLQRSSSLGENRTDCKLVTNKTIKSTNIQTYYLRSSSISEFRWKQAFPRQFVKA